MYLCMAASMIALVLPVTAYSEPSISSGYQKCLQNVDIHAMKSGQWTACAEEDLRALDVKLNAAYKTLKNKSAPEQREFLTRGQRAWLKYREDWCRYEEASELAPGGPANYIFCMKDMTEKQVENLEGMIQ